MSKNRLLVLMAILVIAALVVVGCADEVATPTTPAPAPVEPVTPEPVAFDPLNVKMGQDNYVGTETCATCHTNAMNDWDNSWHARKTNPGPTYGEEFSAKIFPWVKDKWEELDTHMILDTKERNVNYVTVEQYDWTEVDWIIGETRKQRYAIYYDGGPREAYLQYSEDGGITWKVDTSEVVQYEGNLSRAGYKFLTVENRPGEKIYSYGEFWSWQERCIACHTTGFDPVQWDQAKEEFKAGTRDDLRDIFVTDSRIACEACHGPGAEHAKSPMTAGLIINPAKLDKSDPTRKMVCEQCHTRTDAKHKIYPGDSNSVNDLRGFVLGEQDFLDVIGYVRPAWGTGSRAVSIDGKGRRDHQQDMDIRLQDYIVGGSSVHGDMACFDCHAAHTVGKDPNNKSIKGTKPVDSCIGCHGEKSEDYMKVLNGRTGWDSYGFGNWGNEGGRAGHSSHVFNFDAEGRSYGLSPDKYTWALKKDGKASEKADWASIWPWEASYFESKGQTTFTGAEPWSQ